MATPPAHQPEEASEPLRGRHLRRATIAAVASDLTVRYPGNPVPALDRVSLQIVEGEFVAIVGPSGSGKSTLLNMLGALDSPTSGQVTLFGQRLDSCSERRLTAVRREQLGFVFQRYHLIPTLTALENVITPMAGARRSRKRIERARTALASVGLTSHGQQLPGQMSGGEQQRVAIARALVMHPRVILADEPTGNLDAHTGADIMSLLTERSRADGVTLVLATHDLQIARSAQRIITMSDGRITHDVRVTANLTDDTLLDLLAAPAPYHPKSTGRFEHRSASLGAGPAREASKSPKRLCQSNQH